jgi:cytoskeletal protein RodZ
MLYLLATTNKTKIKQMKKYHQTQVSRAKRKKILVVVAVLVLLLAIALLINSRTNTVDVPFLTSDAQQESDNQAEPNPDREPGNTNTSDNDLDPNTPVSNDPDDQELKAASVVIVDASQYGQIVEVRSFVSNHIQEGTCTVRFSKDGRSFSKTTPARPDATTTICLSVEIPRAQFTSTGQWDVFVEYEASGAKGTSPIQKLEIE